MPSDSDDGESSVDEVTVLKKLYQKLRNTLQYHLESLQRNAFSVDEHQKFLLDLQTAVKTISTRKDFQEDINLRLHDLAENLGVICNKNGRLVPGVAKELITDGVKAELASQGNVILSFH
jgi:hypothetical protein